MSRLLAFFTAVSVLLGTGVLYRCLAQDSDQLTDAVARLPLVPMKVGAWQGQDVAREEADERNFERAGAKSYWMRTYVHEPSNTSVLAILMCGRAGRMAVHTPDVCYRGAGYGLLDEPEERTFKNEQGAMLGRFWFGEFTKTARISSSLHLYWAWNAGEGWEAPAAPRWHFLGKPYLYKLYISHDPGNSPRLPTMTDPAADFLRQLVPELNKALFENRRQPT
jgi:hypothetical protein